MNRFSGTARFTTVPHTFPLFYFHVDTLVHIILRHVALFGLNGTLGYKRIHMYYCSVTRAPPVLCRLMLRMRWTATREAMRDKSQGRVPKSVMNL
jgi:hypothetical protein